MKIELTEKKITQWSKLGPRAVYGQALFEIAQMDPDVLAISADLGNSSGLDRMKSGLPSQFINVGIAEQNMIGVAAGLAKEEFIVFASSFAPFISFRAAEQMRMNLGYMNLNVKAVGIGSGISMDFLGNSHFGLEDLAVIRAIPNITILSPADTTEVAKCVQAAYELSGPCYIRLTGKPGGKLIYSSEYDFNLGKAIRLRLGDNIHIFASGAPVAAAVDASDTLKKQGKKVSVFNFHTIRPLDTELLGQFLNPKDTIITLEEHSVEGGLGSAINEFYSQFENRPKVHKLGFPAEFLTTGDYGYMNSFYGLDSEGIVKFISELN